MEWTNRILVCTDLSHGVPLGSSENFGLCDGVKAPRGLPSLLRSEAEPCETDPKLLLIEARSLSSSFLRAVLGIKVQGAPGLAAFARPGSDDEVCRFRP